MKTFFLLVASLSFAIALVACQKSEILVNEPESGKADSFEPVEADTRESITSTPLPVLSFESSTYTNEMAWIALEFPKDWSVKQSELVGEQGWQGGLFSPGSSTEVLADGGSRIMITQYRWDPAGDIEAYTAQRKLAWDAAGFKVLQEKTDFMTDDRAVVNFLVETVEGDKVVFAFLTTGDDYLEINCEGNLELCREVLGTLRPID